MTLKRSNHGSGHSYRIDGVPVSGVTTILGLGLPKPALIRWAARSVAEFVADADSAALDALRAKGRDPMVAALTKVPDGVRDQAAVRGTRNHRIADQLIRGRTLIETDETEGIWGYVESCVKFLDEWRIGPVLVETSVGSRSHGYAGTFDLVADVPDGRRILFDYKTSRSGIFPDTALQLAAYRWAEFYVGTDGTEVPMAEVGIDATYAVWLRSDGYDVIPLDTGRSAADSPQFAGFLRCRDTARMLETMHAWRGDAEVWP